jgi:hypothetical protein
MGNLGATSNGMAEAPVTLKQSIDGILVKVMTPLLLLSNSTTVIANAMIKGNVCSVANTSESYMEQPRIKRLELSSHLMKQNMRGKDDLPTIKLRSRVLCGSLLQYLSNDSNELCIEGTLIF